MNREMTNSEAISNLNHIYGIVSPDIQRSLDVAFKAMKRPQGEWKLHGMIYYCSVCGHDYEQGGNNFCGNCGAEMRGDQDDG